jgi:hypothetical protein
VTYRWADSQTVRQSDTQKQADVIRSLCSCTYIVDLTCKLYPLKEVELQVHTDRQFIDFHYITCIADDRNVVVL